MEARPSRDQCQVMPTPLAERISLRSPAALCCAVPHLLGFHPRASAVLLWLEKGRILLTQRLDLPAHAGDLPEWMSVAWRHSAAQRSDELVLVVVTESGVDALHLELAEAFSVEATDRGVVVRDIVALVHDRWTSLLCGDAMCCPPGGHLIPAHVRLAVDAEFTPEGCAPLPSREDLLVSLARDEATARRVAGTGMLGQRRWKSGAARERWRESSLANLLQWLSVDGGEASDARVAHLLLGLRDVRVRDTVLWEVSHKGPECWRRAQRRLLHLLHAAPEGDTAPVATCLAVVFWLCGDGVRARGSVERALIDDPGYSLALLLERSLAVGLHPDTWTDAMRTLSRDVCRHGDTLL